MRDDFTKKVKDILADRVASQCSNPECPKVTSGPQLDPNKALNIGVAAHITAAAKGGPRFDGSMTPQERKSPENGIWLCQSCSKLIDSDVGRYTVEVLKAWKSAAENRIHRQLSGNAASQVSTSNYIAYKYIPGIDPTSNYATYNIMFTSKVIDSYVAYLESYLGNPFQTSIQGIGAIDELPEGGETRSYRFENYFLSINYDKQGAAQGVRLEGLSRNNYALSNWSEMLQRIGVLVRQEPDISKPIVLAWLNYESYTITVVTDKVNGAINIVRVHKVRPSRTGTQ